MNLQQIGYWRRCRHSPRGETVELRDLFVRSIALGMPWTIPNLVLHDKPVPLSNMRSYGRRHLFVNCGNPDCYHNAELDLSRLPDNVTFSDLQPCSARSAIIAAPTLPARGCITPDRAARPFEYRNHPRLQGFDASAFDSSAFVVNSRVIRAGSCGGSG
jgi:hypothetical protein